MTNPFFPKVQLQGEISDTKVYGFSNPVRFEGFNDTPETPSFKDVMSNMAVNLDKTVKAPDQIMQDALVGNNADIHDVMIAISKAELGLNVATQATTKVLQAYEKIMSIQV
ncbi:MAG: flagellar hook-basal body complex protein FliE [bacterium]